MLFLAELIMMFLREMTESFFKALSIGFFEAVMMHSIPFGFVHEVERLVRVIVAIHPFLQRSTSSCVKRIQDVDVMNIDIRVIDATTDG